MTQNSYEEQNSVSRCKNKFHDAQQKFGRLVTSTGIFISRDHKTSSSLPPCFENTRVSQLLMSASLIPTGDEKEIIKYYFRKGYEYDAIVHFLASSMERTISKHMHMEPPWEPKWQYLLLIFSWLKLKQR